MHVYANTRHLRAPGRSASLQLLRVTPATSSTSSTSRLHRVTGLLRGHPAAATPLKLSRRTQPIALNTNVSFDNNIGRKRWIGVSMLVVLFFLFFWRTPCFRGLGALLKGTWAPAVILHLLPAASAALSQKLHPQVDLEAEPPLTSVKVGTAARMEGWKPEGRS